MSGEIKPESRAAVTMPESTRLFYRTIIPFNIQQAPKYSGAFHFGCSYGDGLKSVLVPWAGIGGLCPPTKSARLEAKFSVNYIWVLFVLSE